MDLYIIGAGNVGGFLAYHAQEMGDYRPVGFLDDDKSKHNQIIYDLSVIGGVEHILGTQKEIAVAVAIANPSFKSAIVQKLKQNNSILFPSFIHPRAWLGKKVTYQEGCIIYPGVTINYETRIGRFATINMNAAIGHNCLLEDYTTVSPGVSCGGFTCLGEQGFMGINSCTLQSVNIGKKSIIGGGAVVINNVPDGVTVVGNPGKIIKK